MKTTKPVFITLLVSAIFYSCSDTGTNSSTAQSPENAAVEVAQAKKPGDLIAGKWNVDNYEISGEAKSSEEDLIDIRKGSWWEFSSGGKVTSNLMNEEFVNGTWTLGDNGKKLTIVSNENGEITYLIMDIEKLDEGNLVLNWKDEEGDMRWTCKK